MTAGKSKLTAEHFAALESWATTEQKCPSCGFSYGAPADYNFDLGKGMDRIGEHAAKSPDCFNKRPLKGEAK